MSAGLGVGPVKLLGWLCACVSPRLGSVSRIEASLAVFGSAGCGCSCSSHPAAATGAAAA